MNDNLKDSINVTSKDFSRNIGRIQHLQKFCQKYNLNIRPLFDDEDPIIIAIEAIRQLAGRNNNIPESDNIEDGDIKVYHGLVVSVSILFNGKEIVKGYFTTDELKDIDSLDDRITIEGFIFI